jgi:hypothetical protein
MTGYVAESRQARNVDVDKLSNQIEAYLGNQGLVRFGGFFWHDQYYHSDKASVALIVHGPTRTVTTHIATGEKKFIDDMVEHFPMLESQGNRRIVKSK